MLEDQTTALNALARIVADSVVPPKILVKPGVNSKDIDGNPWDVAIEIWGNGGYYFAVTSINGDTYDGFRLCLNNVIHHLVTRMTEFHPNARLSGHARYRSVDTEQHQQAVKDLEEHLKSWGVSPDEIKIVMDSRSEMENFAIRHGSLA